MMRFGCGGGGRVCYVDQDGDLTIASGHGYGQQVVIYRAGWFFFHEWLGTRVGPLQLFPGVPLYARWREDESLHLEHRIRGDSAGSVTLSAHEAVELRAFLGECITAGVVTR